MGLVPAVQLTQGQWLEAELAELELAEVAELELELEPEQELDLLGAKPGRRTQKSCCS